MNISLKSLGAILLLGLTLAGTGLAAPPRGTMEHLILSRLHRVQPDEQHQRTLRQLQGEKAPRPPALPSEDKLLGHTLAAVVPLRDVSAVETAEDEFSLPAPLVAAALLRSRFVKYESLPPLHLGASRPITLTWPEQRALRLDFFPGVYDRMKLGSHWLEIPPQVTPQQAADIRRNVVVGRTRKQLETFLTQDGGLFRAFHLERYLLRSGPSSGKVVKFNLEFKPEGMPDEVFRLGKWVAPSPKPGDVMMRVSPPYLEPAYFD